MHRKHKLREARDCVMSQQEVEASRPNDNVKNARPKRETHRTKKLEDFILSKK